MRFVPAGDARPQPDMRLARRRRRPPETRTRARTRGVLSQARGGDRPPARSARLRNHRNSRKPRAGRRAAARRGIRSRSPMSFPDGAIVVVLDQRGENLDSAALAALLREWRAQDRAAVCFIIGGADGLAPSLIERAKLRLAFGAATWPHQTRADHAARAALPRRHDSRRSSLPSGLRSAAFNLARS